jgi:ribonuclease P protein component
VEHLKQWTQYQAVMSSQVVCKTPHFVLHRWNPSPTDRTELPTPEVNAPFQEGCLLLGALTPKRWAKRAVTRNLIKRQIYEVSALFAPLLTPTPHVVRLRAAFDCKQIISAASAALKKTVRAELTELFVKVPAP